MIKIGSETFFEDAFTLGDIEKLHILKSDIDYQIKEKEYAKARNTYKTYLDLLLSHIPEKYREYVLLYKIMSSDAKSTYKLFSECSSCKTPNSSLMNIKVNSDYPSYEIGNGWTVYFEYVTLKDDFRDIEKFVRGVSYNGGHMIDWDRLSDESKESIFSYISNEVVMDIWGSMLLCRAELTGLPEKCCDKCDTLVGKINVNDGFKIFDILINSENLLVMYQTNLELQSRGMSISDQMKMKPFERSIYVNMIVQKEIEERNKNENGISQHRN